MKPLFRLLFAAALSGASLVPAQVQNGFGGPDAIPWRTYKQGQYCRVLSPKQIVITNGANWTTYWNEVTGEPVSQAPKDIDFTREQVVGLHLGLRPTAGYEVYVEAIRQTGPSGVTVYYVEATPPLGQAQAQVQTAPYTMVRMPRVPGIVYFAKKVQQGRPGIDWGKDSCHCCCYCSCGGGPRVIGYIWTMPDLSGNPFDPLQNVQWRTFDTGTASKIEKFETTVMENEASWQSYWAKNFGNPPQTAPKKIDWIKQRAIAINLGNMSGTGASVYVESVQRKRAANLEITYVVTNPAPARGLLPLMRPYVIITMDRVAGIFTYKRKDIQLPPEGQRAKCHCGCGQCKFDR